MSRRSHRWRQGQRGAPRPGGAAPTGSAPSSAVRPAPVERPSSAASPTPSSHGADGGPPSAPTPSHAAVAPIPATPSGDLLAPGAAPAVSSASPIPSPAIALRPLGSPGNQPDPSPTAASLRASRPAAQEVRPRAAFGPGPDGQGGCTVAQLRRFIKSRAYVPLHELRRRFDLPGGEDDVSPVIVQGRRLYVGLRPREADLLGELLGAGDVGYELLLDPSSPLIVGVFPMRPVPRS